MEATAKANTAAMVRGFVLPAPTERLLNAQAELNELKGQREALTRDKVRDEALNKEDLLSLVDLSREEQNLLRTIATDPNDKTPRETLDKVRGTQLVTKDAIEARKSLNLSREGMIEDLNKQIATQIKQTKAATNGYYQQLQQEVEAELLPKLRPMVERLSAVRLLAGMHPNPTLQADCNVVDVVAAEIRMAVAQMTGEHK